MMKLFFATILLLGCFQLILAESNLRRLNAATGAETISNTANGDETQSSTSIHLILARNLAGNQCAKDCDNGDADCLKACFCDCSSGKGRACNKNKPVNDNGNFQCVRSCLCPENGSGANPSVEGNPSDCLKTCGGNKDLPYDLNGDKVENADDIAFVARTIVDPLNELPQGDLAADVNGDGILDLQDLSDIIAYMFTILDPQELAPLTPTILDDIVSFFPILQPLELQPGRRQLERKDQKKQSSPPAWMSHRQLQTCGLAAHANYAKGDKTIEPPRDWTSTHPYDPNWVTAVGDYVFYTAYYVSVPLFFADRGMPEAALAFIHYMNGSGNTLQIDYQTAYNTDGNIKKAVDMEINDVLAAAKAMHDGQEGSFEYHSTSLRGVVVGTERWQAAIGWHSLWSSGTVTYNTAACSLTVDFVINAEDLYDFAEWDGTKDDFFVNYVPGRFAEQGWAKQFLSKGEIRRTETIDLQCCKDEDCGNPTEFECECSLCTTQCPTIQRSGGQGFTSFTVELFKTSGSIEVFYEMYTIPDELTIYYEGTVIFGTGGLVSGSTTQSVSYGSTLSTSTRVTVEVNAPNSGTAWIVSVTCPP
jgi:hypothetical protein